MDITQDMLMTFNNDPDLLKKVIIGDESWVYGYDIETKSQSFQWKAFCYDWRDKRKIETGAVGDTKKRVSEVFQGLEKNTAISVRIISEDGYFKEDKVVIVK